MDYRKGRETTGAEFVQRLDDERHLGAVVNGEGEAGVPAPGALENVKDGLHYATSATASVLPSCSASACSVSIAERIRAAVRWMTSSDSVSKAALPCYRWM